MFSHPGTQIRARMLIRHLKLHGLESGPCRVREAIEKRNFGKQVVQIGGELGHWLELLYDPT
jgi:hypothetical protein